MNKRFIFEVALVCLLIASICFNVVSLSNQPTTLINEKDSTKSITEEKEIRELEKEISRLTSDNTTLKKEVATEKNNNTSDTTQSDAFQDVVKKAFSALYNFDSDETKERKEASAPYLSDDLMKEYFDNSATYGDSAGADSELLNLNLYTQTIQGDDYKGLAVVTYQSRMSGMDWTKGRSIFQVTYDSTTEKITAIQSVTSGTVFE